MIPPLINIDQSDPLALQKHISLTARAVFARGLMPSLVKYSGKDQICVWVRSRVCSGQPFGVGFADAAGRPQFSKQIWATIVRAFDLPLQFPANP